MQFLVLLLALVMSSCITDRNQGLNPKVVQDTIVAQYPKIQRCYTQSIGKEGHAGVLKANFTIDKNGVPKDLKIVDESLGTDSVSECLKGEVLAIRFPKPRGGVDVKVSYPFKFEADHSLTQAAVMDVLKKVNSALCYDEIATAGELKVKLKIGKAGRLEDSTLVFDGTELSEHSPCLMRMLQKQKFPKIVSKQFQSVSVVVTFQADEAKKISEAR